MHHIMVLENVIQEYAWGSKTFIPELLGGPSPSKNSQAELWMGTHPKAPSRVRIQGKAVSLAEIIQQDPEGMLGSSVAKRFSDQLPFLFKVLAASRPLSIQAHPDKERARKGFARENHEGVPLNDPVRNYRDGNHKPELICALKPFWLLKGFRRIRDIVRISDRLGAPFNEMGIDPLRNRPNEEGLKTFFTFFIAMRENRKGLVLDEILNRVKDRKGEDPAFEWIERLHAFYPGDIGILSPIFLNLVCLKPGEAVHIPSGELHTYLEGAGLEIMANSDNVIRGGLTQKHVDAKELIHILHFTSGEPAVLKPREGSKGEFLYPKISDEFMLSRICLDETDQTYEGTQKRSAEIWICVDGKAVVKEKGNEETLQLKKGDSVFIPARAGRYSIRGKVTVYKAFVPIGG